MRRTGNALASISTNSTRVMLYDLYDYERGKQVTEHQKGVLDGIKFTTTQYLSPLKHLHNFNEICEQAVAIILTKLDVMEFDK